MKKSVFKGDPGETGPQGPKGDPGYQRFGGPRKVIYTGVVPNNLEAADFDVHIEGGDGDHYYFKKIDIPEMLLSDAPNLTLYTKIYDEIGDILEEDLWMKNDGNLFFKDGAVYLRYANDNKDGIRYLFPNDGSFKIVAIY